MPDMQTALKTALSRTLQQWDDDGEESPQASTISTTINNSVSAPSQTPIMTNLFNITNNVSRETFNYIKANPGSTRKEIMRALEDRGLAGGSVSSLIAQMRRNKMVHTTNDLYYADIDEYRPIKSNKAMAKIEQAQVQATKRKYTKRDTTGIGALLRAKLEEPAATHTEEQTPPIVPTRKGFVSLVRNRTPESIVDNMTVYQARELYMHLKTLFGG